MPSWYLVSTEDRMIPPGAQIHLFSAVSNEIGNREPKTTNTGAIWQPHSMDVIRSLILWRPDAIHANSDDDRSGGGGVQCGAAGQDQRATEGARSTHHVLQSREGRRIVRAGTRLHRQQ